MKTGQQYIEEVRQSVQEIDVEAFCADRQKFSVIVDVREPEEAAQGVIPGAHCIPRGLLETQLDRLRPADVSESITDWLPKQDVLLYCRSGGRSALAAASLKAMGLKDVYSLSGGWLAWREKGSASKEAPPHP